MTFCANLELEFKISTKGFHMGTTEYIPRELEQIVENYAKLPVVALLGPRQSGKSTLAKHAFPYHAFLNLEDLELRSAAINDPKGFLRHYSNAYGIILDEFQHCPELLSAIQVIVDSDDRPGYFVLTGSQNFLMNKAITQSLAGRVGILTLLPLSLSEILSAQLGNPNSPENAIYRGGYPRIYKRELEPSLLYPSYIQTYVERDVRELLNVTQLSVFQKFMKLCASRVGQLVNFSDLSTQCGISLPTVHKWISVLEASYIIFLLRPHWSNFSKRIIKTPKLYFYDTGIVSTLLEIDSAKHLRLSPYYGHLFENLIIADLKKQFLNRGLPSPLYFWRDQNGHIEIDCLIDRGGQLIPIEIKSGETFNSSYFSQIAKWSALSGGDARKGVVVYGGNQSLSGEKGSLLPWNIGAKLLERIEES